MRLALPLRISCALLCLGLGITWAQKPDKTIQVPTGTLKPLPPGFGIKAPVALWGFADLHTHPASHISFGGNQNAEGGIMWGNPGLGVDSGNAVFSRAMLRSPP